MPSLFLKRLHWLLLGGMIANAAQAVVYPLTPANTDVIGEIKVIYANKDDTLIDIARTHSLGYDEIVHANPGVDRWSPGEGTPIVLPTRYILPDTPRQGIVLNIAELRLYYYPAASAGGERVVHTYPVSIGRMDWKTPLGLAKVVGKEIDPPWRPPASIKAEHAAEGDILPDVVPGGPDNPLGRYAMRLSVPGYLVHGTNKPYGIGMRVTHGCVRMYPEDIEGLFGMVPVDTPVRLIDQPVKVSRVNGELLMEVHEPLEEDNLPIKVTLEQAEKAVIAKLGPEMPGVDQGALRAAMEQISGMPVEISAQAGSTASLPPMGPTPAASRIPARPAPVYPTASLPPARPAPVYPTASLPPARPAPVYPTTANQIPVYPKPTYNNWPATAPAYRPAPPPLSRDTLPYGTPAVADYDDLPYPPGAAAPAYQPAPINSGPYSRYAPPMDRPATSSISDVPQEPPLLK